MKSSNDIPGMISDNAKWLIKKIKENPYINDEEKNRRINFVMGKVSDLMKDYEDGKK